MWRWDQQEPFGVNVPDENRSGIGIFDLPLRLSGQYFDKETNLHYNYFRDYEGSTVNDGQNSYVYDARGPMVQATSIVGATN